MDYLARLIHDLVVPTVLGGVIFVALFTAIVHALVKRVVTNVQDKLLKKIAKHVDYSRPRVDERILTIFRLFKHITSILIWAVGILMAFAVLGIDITPIVTGLGLAGFSLSLGMRDVVRDIVSGLSFILTGTLLTGESVKIKDVEGTVELIGLRHVYIRDKEGKLHLISNRDINHIVKNIVKKVDAGTSKSK